LILSYDGTDYHGWQSQSGEATIQQTVENAIQNVTGSQSTVYGSGRTDAGVHAAAQVANFKTACPIPCANLVKALNDQLPPTIRVREAIEVPLDFHARYHAREKSYRYRIYLGPVCPPSLWRFVYHHPYPLDQNSMAEAARLIEGEHDFRSFAASGGEESEARSQESEGQTQNSARRGTVRTIYSSRITHLGKLSLLRYDVRGNGFLHHMVRNIVGTLLEVGRGKLAPEDMLRILEARDRTRAGPTAPAQGLCLTKVIY
jgi:tRNA pseudouridine38-40 synthase